MAYFIAGKSDCSFCERAKELLDIVGEDYTYVDIYSREDLLDWASTNNITTVPQIWKGDLHIGGFTDLVEYLDEQ